MSACPLSPPGPDSVPDDSSSTAERAQAYCRAKAGTPLLSSLTSTDIKLTIMTSEYLNSAAEGRSSALPVKAYHQDTPKNAYDLVREICSSFSLVPRKLMLWWTTLVHDQNFCFPVKALESQGVRLEPLIVRRLRFAHPFEASQSWFTDLFSIRSLLAALSPCEGAIRPHLGIPWQLCVPLLWRSHPH